MIHNNGKGEKVKTKEGGPQNKPETGESIDTEPQEWEWSKNGNETGGGPPNKSKTKEQTNTKPKQGSQLASCRAVFLVLFVYLNEEWATRC